MDSDNPAETTLQFLLEASLAGTFFNPLRDEGLTFAPDDGSVDLSITPKDTKFIQSGCDLKISKRYKCSDMDREFVANLLDHRFKTFAGMPFSLPVRIRDEVVINENGEICLSYLVPFEMIPPSLQTLIEFARRNLVETSMRFVGLMRWTQEIDGPHDPIEPFPLLSWKSDRTKFSQVPRRSGQFNGRSPVGMKWTAVDQREIFALWDGDSKEPLGHSLLREGVSVGSNSERSCVLILATAVETSVKDHIARRVAGAEWLLRNLPSPPMFKVVRDYIPSINDTNSEVISKWQKLGRIFKEIDRLFEVRNAVTHKGDNDIVGIDRLVAAVSDFLYILDVLDGHEWAKGLVSPETRNVFGWSSRHQRRFFRQIPQFPEDLRRHLMEMERKPLQSR